MTTTTLPIIVTVDQIDIDHAGVGALRCPIADAIRRTLGFPVSVIEGGGIYTLDQDGGHDVELRNPRMKLISDVRCPDLDDQVAWYISLYDHEGREAVGPGLQVQLDVPFDLIPTLDLIDMGAVHG